MILMTALYKFWLRQNQNDLPPYTIKRKPKLISERQSSTTTTKPLIRSYAQILRGIILILSTVLLDANDLINFELSSDRSVWSLVFFPNTKFGSVKNS